MNNRNTINHLTTQSLVQLFLMYVMIVDVSAAISAAPGVSAISSGVAPGAAVTAPAV